MTRRHGRASLRSGALPDTWPGLFWRLAERGGAVWWRGLLLILAVLALLGLAGGHIMALVFSVFR